MNVHPAVKRRYRRHRHVRRALAPLEVVIITGMIVPSCIIMLYVGFRAMAAFLSVLGTMIGSPLG